MTATGFRIWGILPPSVNHSDRSGRTLLCAVPTRGLATFGFDPWHEPDSVRDDRTAPPAWGRRTPPTNPNVARRRSSIRGIRPGGRFRPRLGGRGDWSVVFYI